MVPNQARYRSARQDDYPAHQLFPPAKLPKVDSLGHFVGISELRSGYIYYFDIAPGRFCADHQVVHSHSQLW